MAFKHPEFLWGFLLLLIPIAVHLLQFRKRKKILFPGVSRLFKALQVSQKQRNIRFWLLLTLRSLFISFLVIGFAQPYVPRNLKTNQVRWIVIYDHSPSMFLPNTEGESAHQQAQELLQEWLKSGPTQQSFALVTSENSQGWIDAGQLRSSLGVIAENSRPRNLREMMGRAQNWVNRAKEDGFSPKVLIVSDFQSDFLSGYNPTVISTDLLNSCSFLKVGRQTIGKDEFNLALDTVYFNKDKSGLKVQVSLHSLQATQVLTNVSLWANGVIKAQKSIQFNEQETTTSVKEVEFNLNGLKLDSFRVAISGDQFLADNQLFCVFSTSRRQKIFVEPQFEGYNEFEKIFTIQPERFEWVKNEQEADWLIQKRNLNDLKSYQGNARRMIFLNGESTKLTATSSFSRLESNFLDLPVFEGFLKTALDDKTPLPEVSVNEPWSDRLAKDFDAVIQTENKQSVLFRNDQADRIDFIWAASWKDGLQKVRKSMWFLPLFSQLIYGSSPSSDEFYVQQNGVLDLDAKLHLSLEKSLSISSLGDSSVSWLANVQNVERGLGVQMGEEIQRSGFYQLKGAGFEQIFAINVQNREFKNGPLGDLKYYRDQGVKMIETELDLIDNASSENLFNWTQWFLFVALGLILLESWVLYNTFRTKIVNSQKQA